MTTDLHGELLRLASELETAAFAVGGIDVEDDAAWGAALARLSEVRADLYAAIRRVP